MTDTARRPAPARLDQGRLVVQARGPTPPWLQGVELAGQAGQVETARRLLNNEAVEALQREVDHDPGRVDLLYLAGRFLVNLDRAEDAVRVLCKAFEIEPCCAGAFEISELLHSLGYVCESAQWARKAAEADPDNTDCLLRLGHALLDSGAIEEGLGLMHQVLERRPEDTFVRALLLGRGHYLPGHGRDNFLEGYKALGHLISSKVTVQARHANTPDPDRRLRIGVLSPFFRDNSVAYTFEPFLDGYDRQALEVHAYANMKPEHADTATERMLPKFHRFRYIRGMNASEVADLVQQDQIDLLAGIGGYVSGHRLDVMARRPAPIQMDLGSVDTTGLSQIDYRLTDLVADPAEWNGAYVETSVYLPGGSTCYRPIQSPAQVSALPALSNGYVTFGAFHDHLKLNPFVLSLCARILKALDCSRLIVKFPAAKDPGMVRWFRDRCQDAGLDADRVEVMAWSPHDQHLSVYDRVDLMLDTFPHNAAIMTLEALWMGVPTVSLAGELFVSRMGLMLLGRLGLDVFAARTADEYVDKAVSFARQVHALAQIRAQLRPLMLNSPLCNPGRYGSELTWAFRHMWYRWCRSQGVAVPHPEPKGLFGDNMI